MSVIQEQFAKEFALYEFPFEKADDKILKMDEGERKEYFRQAKEDVLESKVWSIEIQELIRVFYQELAIKTTTEVEREAYRLTLIALQKLNARMVGLAQRNKK